MSLRSMTLVILSVVILVSACLIGAIDRFILYPNFLALERDEAVEDMARCREAIQREIQHLETFTRDWSSWDDSWHFVEDRNAAYVETNLAFDTFVDARVNLLYFLDSSGRVVWGKFYDLATGDLIHVNELPSTGVWPSDHPLLTFDLQSDRIGGVNVSGILTTEVGPVILASAPILTSNNEGPVHGTLITGRLLDAEAVSHISSQTRVNLSIADTRRAQDPRIAADFMVNANPSRSPRVVAVNDEMLHVFATYPDLLGNPGIYMRAEIPRSISMRGKAASRVTILSIMASGALVLAALAAALQYTVIGPLAGITAVARTIAHGDYTIRPAVRGSSELRSLAASIAAMSSSIQQHIAELRQQNASLLEQINQRERLSAAIEQASEMVLILDLNGRIEYVNPAFERVTGYTRHEVIGTDLRALAAAPIDSALEQAIAIRLAEGQPWSGRFTGRKKNGSEYVEEATITPVRDTTGTISNCVMVKRDITTELQLEEQLRESQKMEAIGQLAGGVAHDFNNLLQIIQGFGELAIEASPPQGTAREAASEILRASERAAALVSQLLAFSRRQVLELTDLSLNDVVVDVMRMIRRVIGDHIEISFVADEELRLIRADKGQIEHILMNLCVNARDAMPDGGSITIETANVNVDSQFCTRHSWAMPGEYVLLCVSDTGFGMDSDTLASIFEPFYTTKPMGHGTGLGLSTVYGLVKQHNGMIHAYSEPGNGTVFRIYLPSVRSATPVAAPEPVGAGLGGTETILVAEDNDAILRLTRDVLEKAGYRVLVAADGDEAVLVFDAHQMEIDLALIDLMMPKRNGTAVYAHIQAVKPSTRVLFASGYSKSGIHTQFVLQEGIHLIQKPYQSQSLLHKIRELLDAPPPS